MRKFSAIVTLIFLCLSFLACGRTLTQDTSAPSETAEATENPTEEPAPEATTDLMLNEDGTLDGMSYKYNSAWQETTDPLTNAILRTYNIDLGNNGTVVLQLASLNDEGTSTAVQNLPKNAVKPLNLFMGI